MEVIEKMEDAQYEAICAAGVEFARELSAVLARHGLSREHAFNVLVVAAAGVSAASELTSMHLAHGVDHVIPMWRVVDSNGERSIVFDPSGVSAETGPSAVN